MEIGICGYCPGFQRRTSLRPHCFSMPRIARVVAEGVAHHVTQRGNGCQQVFRSPADFALYKDLLMRYAERSGLVLWAYCLMPNHIHLVCVPMGKESLPSALGRTHADYAKHFNIARRTCGHVWQARYFSCPMDRWHCWRAMAYESAIPCGRGLSPPPLSTPGPARLRTRDGRLTRWSISWNGGASTMPPDGAQF